MVEFTFATEVGGFDSHIDSSIRGYQDLWGDVLKFSEYFVEDETTVIDIGCSTGRLLKAMKIQNDRFAPQCTYRGIELESSFFPELGDEDRLTFEKLDVRNFDWDKKAINCCMVTSLFTLQFLPKRDRQQLIEQIHDSLSKGGAFIFSEKLLSSTSQLEEMMTFCYYDWKRKHFSAEQILEKEEKLRHMMKPLCLDDLIALVKSAGFRDIQTFWQNFNFVGIIALKS